MFNMTDRKYDKKTLRNVLIFSLVVLSCGWVGRLVDLKVGTDANGSLGQLIWLVLPLLTTIILRSFMGDGWRDLGIELKFRGNLFPYFISILFIPVITVIIVLIGHNLKLIDTSNFSSSFLLAFSLALLPMFFKNIFEEFAWRGYLAPKLFSMGINRFLCHICVGVIWALWHIPYLLVLVDTAESLLTYIPRVMIGLVILSVVYGEIRYVTNSVWPAVILHTIANALVDTLILKKYLDVREGYEYLVTPSPEGVFTIVITAIVGLWLYKRHTKKKRLTPHTVKQNRA
ncbi:CPBP family intramembrane metalloprotease [Bacillus sp. V33-4]|nr:CPBP family intramembrane metalloprotease [Bacillus sp. V33-4]